MAREFTQAELEAYLDEALTAAEMSEIESCLRDEPKLTERLRAINGRRDAGIHSLGEIWRRHRISCPDRNQLGSYLLGVLEPAEQKQIQFHLDRVGCRFCAANLEDLEVLQREVEGTTKNRRRRYYQSSAGYLKPDD